MMEDGEEDEEEEEEEEEDEEDEEEAFEVLKPRKRIGRPPKVWSSILLPKEVTSTLGTRKNWSAKPQKVSQSAKSTNSNGGDGSHSRFSPSNMVGQTVHGVVDGCFDAGFLVSLRIGDSDSLYRGVFFGPGLSIPVSKESDIAKNVIQRHRKRKQLSTSATSREEPSSSTPPHSAGGPREEAPLLSDPTLPQPPSHYEAAPAAQHAPHPNNAHAMESAHISPPIPPPPHSHQFAYNDAMHANNFRAPRPPHPEMNVGPFMHTGSFPPRPSMPMPPTAQGYSPRQSFGHAVPSPSSPYGYSFASAQGRPNRPIPPQYRGPAADPQYRGPQA